MRYAASCFASVGLLLGIALGAGACFDDPKADGGSDCTTGEEGCSCLQNATCFGTLVCVQGLCLADSGETQGDGDGDSGDGDGDGDSGDGDGDGDPGETVVLDMYAEACAAASKWVAESENLNVETPIPCDEVGTEVTGWMVRYPALTVGSETYNNVISIVAGAQLSDHVYGLYNLDNLPNPSELEFRADVLLRCASGDTDCAGDFGLVVAEDVENGLIQPVEFLSLTPGEAAMSVTVPLNLLVTLTEPSVVLVGQRSEVDGNPSPEVLIVNPRLVLP